MTPAELAVYVRLGTRTNSTTFSDADMLVMLNLFKEQVCQRALETDEDIFELPTYMNLVANQREYPLNTAILSRIGRVEAKLDGTNWLKLNEIDLTEIGFPITSETDITNHFSNNTGQSGYDIMRKALQIYSGTITNVTDGLRIWLNTFPAAVASMALSTDMSVDPSTTTHGIPKELHLVIADRIIIFWKGSREKPIPLTERESNWEFYLEKAIQTLKKGNYDREVIGEVPGGTTNMENEDGSNL